MSKLPAVDRRRSWIWFAAAGLATGVFAGLAAATYLSLDSLMRGMGPWAPSNLMAGGFFPSTALSQSFSTATLAGLSLQVLWFGAAGAAAVPLLAPLISRTLLYRLAALFFSLAWYYGLLRFGVVEWNSLLVIYQPFPGLILAHLVFGFCLGLFPIAFEDALRAS